MDAIALYETIIEAAFASGFESHNDELDERAANAILAYGGDVNQPLSHGKQSGRTMFAHPCFRKARPDLVKVQLLLFLYAWALWLRSKLTLHCLCYCAVHKATPAFNQVAKRQKRATDTNTIQA